MTVCTGVYDCVQVCVTMCTGVYDSVYRCVWHTGVSDCEHVRLGRVDIGGIRFSVTGLLLLVLFLIVVTKG